MEKENTINVNVNNSEIINKTHEIIFEDISKKIKKKENVKKAVRVA